MNNEWKPIGVVHPNCEKQNKNNIVELEKELANEKSLRIEWQKRYEGLDIVHQSTLKGVELWKKATGRIDPEALDLELGRAGIDTHLQVLREMLDAERKALARAERAYIFEKKNASELYERNLKLEEFVRAFDKWWAYCLRNDLPVHGYAPLLAARDQVKL